MYVATFGAVTTISNEFLCSLQTNGRLMELSHGDGKLNVHYSERLVTLIREVRQLAALGFPIPTKIQSTADVANKFYRHGVILKQVIKTSVYISCETFHIPGIVSNYLDTRNILRYHVIISSFLQLHHSFI